jgi:uncharacterized membrane protein
MTWRTGTGVRLGGVAATALAMLLALLTVATTVPAESATARPTTASSKNFLLRKGVLRPLGDIRGSMSTAYFGVNNKGETVGAYSDADGTPHGFLRDKRGRFETIDVPGASLTLALGINERGKVVGQYVDTAGGFHGFLRGRNGDITTFDVPGAVGTTYTYGINNRGQIVGFYADAGGAVHGFVRGKRSFRTIDVPGATKSAAIDINERGEIVGGYAGADGITHGFRLRRGVFTTIDPPGAAELPEIAATVPFGINNRGQIVGQYADARGLHAYLLEKGRYKTIDPRGVRGTVAADINDRGQIVLPAPGELFLTGGS